MKRYIYIVLVTVVLIFLLIYFYDLKEMVVNKKYVDNNKNIYIEYPYFNNRVIDKYINNYLKETISNSYNYKLFMDYDYNIDNDIINLYIYTYKEKDNSLRKVVKEIEIDSNSGNIRDRIVKDSEENIKYDFYKNNVIDNSDKLIAITFDDGPNANTSRILDVLEKYNVKATFFVLGINIKGNEEVIKRMKSLNMQIGNHMYSHKLSSKLKKKEFFREINKTDKLIYDITGDKVKILRPSYGAISKDYRRIVNKPIITWSIDTKDWKYHNSKRISEHILNKVADGDIILMHDIYSATLKSLELVIPKLLEKGYRLVTVYELAYYKEVELEKGKIYPNID